MKRKIGFALIGFAVLGLIVFVYYKKNTGASTETVFASSAEISSDSPKIKKAPAVKIADTAPKKAYQGRVPILAYHGVGAVESRWTRSVKNFKKDLKWLYDNDYVLFSIEDFADSRYNVIPEGKKPVVFTFDDGKLSHFKMLEDGKIDPDCAIGLLDAFYEQHPDFGRAAVFYVNANPFGQKDLVKQKMEYLISTGRQIGFHTLWHSNMRALSPTQNQKILLEQAAEFQKILPPGTRVDTIAYPHGLTPAGGMKPVSDARKNDVSYKINVGLLVGAEPARQLNDPLADPFRVPRIQAIDSEWLRHFKRKAY